MLRLDCAVRSFKDPLRRLPRRRMKSILTGDSGRVYTKSQLLRRHPHDPNLDIFTAKSSEKSYVFKRVPKPFFELSQRLASETAALPSLRLHVDSKSAESILIYDYFQDTFLSLLQNDPSLSPDARLKIMRAVGEAVQELHSNDWVHTDIKPDNVFVDWTNDDNGNKMVTKVALGDFDIACKLKQGETRVTPHAVGNAMWRSPEAQTGLATRASDIYSLGLVYLYAVGAADLLILKNYQELLKAGISAEQEVITKHFCYFGPVPDSLYDVIKDEDWRNALQSASKIAEAEVAERPIMRLEVWGRELGETAYQFFAGMMKLDPRARFNIKEVLSHPYWQESAS